MGKCEISYEIQNLTWSIVISDLIILEGIENNTININDFYQLIVTKKMYMWDLIEYKDMVAFKLPTERKVYIYSKKYWDHRCSRNLLHLKVIKFQD